MIGIWKDTNYWYADINGSTICLHVDVDVPRYIVEDLISNLLLHGRDFLEYTSKQITFTELN